MQSPGFELQKFLEDLGDFIKRTANVFKLYLAKSVRSVEEGYVYMSVCGNRRIHRNEVVGDMNK